MDKTQSHLLIIQPQLEKVRDLIGDSLADPDRRLGPLLDHISLTRGKMLRPALVLLSGKCFADITDKHISVAAIVELIHITTLLHDDVIDQSAIRRGKPSINNLYDNKTAILAGDFVFSKAFELCASVENTAISNLLASTTNSLCRGEIRQNLTQNDYTITEDEYLGIISEKSASLFGSCCRVGAMISNADENRCEALKQFGSNLGIAFQIIDDILDVAGSPDTTGKPLAGDIKNSIPTLPVIYLMQLSSPKKHDDLIRQFTDPDISTDQKIMLLTANGVIKQAREKAAWYISQAVGHLDTVNQSPAKTALSEIAKSFLNIEIN